MRNSRGEVVGSELIGQVFSRPEYFHPRPSAAGAGYDAAASGGSNLGPTNRRLLAAVGERALAFRQENGLDSETPVPADAVTASASGLDPHITPANAYLQVRRVARARGLPEETVRELVDRFIKAPLFGFLGQPRVNVVKLNRALDELKEGWK
jgi:K+-transporting ATPase ATPase C chain